MEFGCSHGTFSAIEVTSLNPNPCESIKGKPSYTQSHFQIILDYSNTCMIGPHINPSFTLVALLLLIMALRRIASE